jgi:anti-anti-sigma factor
MIRTVVTAPTTLGIASREDFRRQAMEALGHVRAAADSSELVIDLSGTDSVDSAGLGVLVLIRRRAADEGKTVRLRGVSEELRFLLAVTRLDDRFVIEATAAT